MGALYSMSDVRAAPLLTDTPVELSKLLQTCFHQVENKITELIQRILIGLVLTIAPSQRSVRAMI